MHNRDNDSPMNDELRHHCSSFIRITTMPEEQINQVLELIDGEIRTEGCLFAFFADDTDTNICCEDHADIVTSIPDTKGFLLSIELDAICHIGLLGWRASTTDDSSDSAGQGKEHTLVVFSHSMQRLAVYH